MEMNNVHDEIEAAKVDTAGMRDEEVDDQHENVVAESALHSSANTVNSATTSQTSSSGSRKSKRSMMRMNVGFPGSRPYNPMQVVTPEQLQAFSLLVTTPIWIFDFIKRKNRYSNQAGLDLWSAPSLDEFLNRNMKDMSAASVARTQEIQNRIERAQVVQDMWTFYPKGKAKTLQITITAVRLSADEDHCSIFVVANMTSSNLSNTHVALTRNSICSASTSLSTPNTNLTATTQATTISDVSKSTELSNSNAEKRDIEERNETTQVVTPLTSDEGDVGAQDDESVVEEHRKDDERYEEEKIPAEDEIDDPDDTETAPVNHILESSAHDISNQHHIAAMDEDHPVNQEIIRGVEIIRHLPMAVCQFDMKGRVMFQNPAAYLPPLDDEEEKECMDDESLMDGMDTDDESEYYDHLFEQQYGGVQTLASNNGRGNFMDRFVNKKVARELLESLQDKPEKERSNSTISTATFNALNNTTTISIEAELHSTTRGRTQWSAIQLRKTKDPVTSRSVILYSAQDKSDAMEAKREREARLQKSEFLAIMAHEIRTPLHQVTGFIDLLELDATNTTITSTTSAGSINLSSKVNTVDKHHDSTSQNAIFHNSHDGGVLNTFDRSSFITKVRGSSLKKSKSAKSSWPSSSRQSIGNFTSEQRNYIKLLKSSANQLMTVISDVLDYSKLEAGKMKIERIPFELLSVVQGSMEAVRGSCEEKGLHLTLEYGGSDDDFHDEDEITGENAESDANVDRRGKFRRRRTLSFNGSIANSRPMRKRKVSRTRSFKENNKSSDPQIKSNDIPFRILGDPNRLRQVLLNLLSNAVKFTEKGGIHVRVSSSTKECVSPAKAPDDHDESSQQMSPPPTFVERKDDGKTTASGGSSTNSSDDKTKKPHDTRGRPRSIRIIVSDTGMGISKEQQYTIFEKYQQANLSVARNFGGTGLGLSICKLLVEQVMGGWIGVDSDEGRGSSFYITLPIEVPEDCKDDTSRGVIGGENNLEVNDSMNILVAEDNKINQKLVANMLKRMGHKSTLVENGRQAIDMISKMHLKEQCSNSGCSSSCLGFDAVLMDIQMPVMDGLEATRRLRTMGFTNLPIVGLTASVKRSDYIELGFNDWLPKPILMKELKAKLLKLQTDKMENNHSEDSDE